MLHHSLGKPAVRQWERDVDKMNAMFHASFLNPFTIEDALAHLVNFASGVTASQEIENSPVPLSMFKEDGTMITSKKSELMYRLETLVPNKLTISEIVDSTVYDGPAVIQLLKTPQNQMSVSFSEMASHFMRYIFAANHMYSREALQIHIVFDRYFKTA